LQNSIPHLLSLKAPLLALLYQMGVLQKTGQTIHSGPAKHGRKCVAYNIIGSSSDGVRQTQEAQIVLEQVHAVIRRNHTSTLYHIDKRFQ
jgi:hypothetical protein